MIMRQSQRNELVADLAVLEEGMSFFPKSFRQKSLYEKCWTATKRFGSELMEQKSVHNVDASAHRACSFEGLIKLVVFYSWSTQIMSSLPKW